MIPEEFFERKNITCSADELIEAEQDVVNETSNSTKIKVVKCISNLADYYQLEKTAGLLLEIIEKLKEGRGLDDPLYGLALTIEQILDEKKFESAEKYKNLFENSPDALMTVSTEDWSFSEGNPQTFKIFGIEDEEEFKSIQPWELSPKRQPDGRLSAEKAVEMLQIAAIEGENYFEWTHKRKNGEEFPATVLLSRLFINGKMIIQATVREITKEKEKEKERERESLQTQYNQAQKMEAIGTLAGGIAHNFNNILTVIIPNLDFAMEDIDKNSQTYTDLETCKNACKKAAELTKGILAFSRKQPLHIEQIDINAELAQIMSTLRRIVASDVDIQLSSENKIGIINADKSQILSIVANLVTNARHAMPEGGTILIETRNKSFSEETLPKSEGARTGNYVELSVSDTGTGIDEKDLYKIFEPFYTTKKVGEGTGLGLAMIHGSVLQQGGFITVESELDKGTTFKLYIPVNNNAKQILDSVPENNLPRGNETIMVVEDEPQVRNVVIRIFRKLGYKIIEAENAGIAFLKLEDLQKEGTPVDLILTDIKMPQMSGTTLDKKIKEHGFNTEVVFMSGYPNEDNDLLKGREFISKPFEADKLAKTIRRVLDTRKRDEDK